MANKVRTDISKITEKSPYQDITPGNVVYGGGGAVDFLTGEWRTQTPVIDWDKCVQCLLCAPMCPDSSGLRNLCRLLLLRCNYYEGGPVNVKG